MKNISRESVKVAGITAEKVVGIPADYGAMVVYVVKNDKIFRIDLDFRLSPPQNQLSNEHIEIFNQILSTFKFTP